MHCPICTLPGSILAVTGYALVLLSLYWKVLLYIGLVIVVSAFIVPHLLPRRSCRMELGEPDPGSDPPPPESDRA